MSDDSTFMFDINFISLGIFKLKAQKELFLEEEIIKNDTFKGEF